jgi:hypothetical protein
METPRLYFVLQNSRGHAKDLIRNLERNLAHCLKELSQPWFGVFNAAVS